MGFEQLAELKKQLAAKAKAEQPSTESNTQSGASAAQEPGRREQRNHADKAGKGERSARPQHKRDGRGPATDGAHRRPRSGEANRDKAAAESQRNNRPARKPSEPVDPVVLSIGRLQKHYPATFPKNPAPKLPLKIGIHQDLLAKAKDLGLEEAAITEAVKTWCRGTRYWASIVEDAPRIDLEGQPAGTVSARDAALARSLENRRKARQAKPKAAEATTAETSPAETTLVAEQANAEITVETQPAVEAVATPAAPAPDAE